MSVAIQFVLLGLGIGAVYGLSALGLVVVFRSSGVLNFASGAMGAIAAFIFYGLRNGGMNLPLALVIAVVIGAAMGAVTQFLIMRPMRNSSAVVKLIATLALFSGLQGYALVQWGSVTQIVTPLFPIHLISLGGGVSISEETIWLFGLTVVLGGLLWLVYNKTMFGLATSAVAEDRRTASSLGWSSNRIELANWTLGGALYALTAILLAPTLGLSVTTLSLIVLPALAAALVGGFASFPLTILGGIVLGVVESELTRYVTVPGLASSVPFLLIIVVIVAGGRARPARGDLPTRLPLPGRGRINRPAIIIAVAATATFIWTANPQWIDATTTTLVEALLVLSVIVVTGLCGQLSLGQWALGGVGALIAGRLVAGAGFPFWAAALVGMIATIPVGLIVALPALRTRGVNLGIVTLGLALAIQAVILSNGALTGGTYGTTVGSPHLFSLDIDMTLYPARYATLALAVFLLMALAVANLRRGTTGRRMLAVRSNERVAASLGIRVYSVKLYAFGLAALIAGAAGILSAFQEYDILYSQFDIFGSINAVIYAVIGGVGWIAGALIGALMVPSGLLATLINGLGDINAWLPVISGVLLILTLLQAPNGVAELNAATYHAVVGFVRRSFKRGKGPDTASQVPELLREPKRASGLTIRDSEPLQLKISGLTVRYGGILALENLEFIARPGQVTGLIGPNGAGKTTLLDAVSGFIRPSAGTLSLNNLVVNDWSVERRARAGLGRAFQSVELFPEMTVGENLLVAVDHRGAARYLIDMVRPGSPRADALTREVIADFELEQYLDSMPSQLPHGTARLVGIARSLVSNGRVLLLDEPAAGLDRHEREELGSQIIRIARERNVAVVLVEHDVELVMRTCDRITVLDFGRSIAEGTPAQIGNDGAVMDAYLGRAETEPTIRGPAIGEPKPGA